MSSAVYLTFDEPVPLDEWLVFCDAYDVAYSPHTVGRNAFYRDQVELTFGDAARDDLPLLPDGRLDFSAARPPEAAGRITISSYWMTHLPEVAAVARAVLARWPRCSWSCDPELRRWIDPPDA